MKTLYNEDSITRLLNDTKQRTFGIIEHPSHHKASITSHIQQKYDIGTIAITVDGTPVGYIITSDVDDDGRLKGTIKTLCKEHALTEYFLYANEDLNKYVITEKEPTSTFTWNPKNIFEYLNIPNGKLQFLVGPYGPLNRSIQEY